MVRIFIISLFLLAKISMAADGHECAVKSGNSTAKLVTSIVSPGRLSLAFFLAETNDGKINLLPLMSTEAGNAYTAEIPNALKAKDSISKKVKDAMPDRALGIYSSLLLNKTLLDFQKGFITADVFIFSRSIIMQIRNEEKTSEVIGRTLAKLDTTWEKSENLKVKVPYLKQDKTWGRVEIGLSCL